MNDISEGGEAAALRHAERLDKFVPTEARPVVLLKEQLEARSAGLDAQTKADIEAAHANIRGFADAQRASMQDFETSPAPGIVLGQKQVPVNSVGCYSPAGRFCHVASVLMTVATAKAAGVKNVTLCCPPYRSPGEDSPWVHPAQAYAALVSGADRVLCMGGVQAISCMAYGLFGAVPADVICGPGNAFVAEAKALLAEKGVSGIDLFAGPTESGIIADETANPEHVAIDLISQAEHGPTSKTVLFALDRKLAEYVAKRAPELAVDLGADSAAATSWRNVGEIILCDSREEAVRRSDEYALEHMQVHTGDDDYFLQNMTAYGGLFCGPGNTVSLGDKCLGPNHTLPTMRAGRFTGGLTVSKLVRTVTWSRVTTEGAQTVAPLAARISRYEGMEGHARAADSRTESKTAAHAA